MTTFFILQRGDGDPMAGHSTAGIDASSAEAGPPLRIPADGTTEHPLGDLYSHMDFIGMDEPPLVIASAALFEKLSALAAGALKSEPVEIIDTHDKPQRFFAVRAVHVVEPRDAQPGDLEWAGTAFNPSGAPAVLGVGQYLVVSGEIGKALGVEEFAEVTLSEFSAA